MADAVVCEGPTSPLDSVIELVRLDFSIVVLAEEYQDVGNGVLYTGSIGTPAFDQSPRAPVYPWQGPRREGCFRSPHMLPYTVGTVGKCGIQRQQKGGGKDRDKRL